MSEDGAAAEPEVLLFTDLEDEQQQQQQGRVVSPTRHSCPLCSRPFDEASSLVSHMAEAHGDVGLQACPVCGRSCRRPADLRAHISLHLGVRRGVCDVCGRQFSHRSNLYRHLRTHTGEKPYVCSVCHRRFSQANALKAHKETHQAKEEHHRCPDCPKRFRKKSLLAKHVRLIHSPRRRPSWTRGPRQHRFHCGVCGASFPSRLQLRRHQAAHPAASLHCGLCRLSFPTAQLMSRHCCRPALTPHQEGESLSLSADSDGSLAQPETVDPADGDQLIATGGHPLPSVPSPHHTAPAQETGPLTWSSEHSPHQADQPASPPGPDDPLAPSPQQAEPLTAPQWVGPVTSSQQADPLVSSELAPLLTDISQTQEHHYDHVIDCVARGVLPADASAAGFSCSVCGRVFSRVHNLRQHRALHDASLQRFSCPHCPLKFAWQQTRDRHVLRHAGVQRVPCPLCQQLFLPDSLRGHYQRVHLNTRHFLCPLCRKGFHRRSELQVHMRSHTQEKPYVCAQCGRQFGHLTHLRRHENKHSVSQREVSGSGAGQGSVTSPTDIVTSPSDIVTSPSDIVTSPTDIVQHSVVTARIPQREAELELSSEGPEIFNQHYVVLNMEQGSSEYVIVVKQAAEPTPAPTPCT